MRWKSSAFGCVLALLCWQCPGITPGTTNNDRYGQIPNRNIFGLKPPSIIQDTNPVPPSLPKLVLAGISTVTGKKQAFLRLEGNAASAKPGEAAKEQSVILAEGQREGPVEVLKIDEHAGAVRVNNSGTPETLTFERNGPKLANASPVPPPAPAGVAPGQPTNAVPAGYPGLRSLPTRNPRLAPTGQPSGYAYPPTNVNTAVPPPPALTPNPPPLNQPVVVPTAPGTAAVSTERPLTAEEQAVLDEVQRAMNANTATNNTGTYVPKRVIPAPGINLPMEPPGATAPGRTPPIEPQ
jgi:hypothetical protein